MKYALKTADNSSLFLRPENGQPIFVDDPAVPDEYWPVDATIPAGHRQTGWSLTGGMCVAQTELIPAPDVNAVPAQVSNAQFRDAVTLAGIMPDDVKTAILAISDAVQRQLALNKWEYANFIERKHPMLAALAPAFDLTSEQVDELFRTAATL